MTMPSPYLAVPLFKQLHALKEFFITFKAKEMPYYLMGLCLYVCMGPGMCCSHSLGEPVSPGLSFFMLFSVSVSAGLCVPSTCVHAHTHTHIHTHTQVHRHSQFAALLLPPCPLGVSISHSLPCPLTFPSSHITCPSANFYSK